MDSASAATDLIYREALYVDRREWDLWLALYREDADFWVPVWTGEDRLTEDVDNEISLIYHDSRAGLEERVDRVRSAQTVTAMPLPRTVHLVGNVIVEDQGADFINLCSAWSCHVYNPRSSKEYMFHGHYEHRLRITEGEWKIARKKVILLNDRIPTVLDFYSI